MRCRLRLNGIPEGDRNLLIDSVDLSSRVRCTEQMHVPYLSNYLSLSLSPHVSVHPSAYLSGV